MSHNPRSFLDYVTPKLFRAIIMDPGSIGTHVQIVATRLQTGGVSRKQFQIELFGQTDPFSFPVGHLMDHRVRMPLATAKAALKAGPEEVRRLLWRMLCMAPHHEAEVIVAETLGRDPQEDSEFFCEIQPAYPTFAELCLSGRLGDFYWKVKLPPPEVVRKVVGMMLVYYCALECQLISLRLRAIDQYRIGVGEMTETGTLGWHVKDIGDMFAGLNRAASEVKSERPSRGVYSAGVVETKPFAEQLVKRLRQSSPRMNDNTLKGTIKKFLEAIDATRLGGAATFNRLYGDLKEGVPGGTQPLRQLSTSTIEGETAGHQVAFALIRLLALADGAEIAAKDAGTQWEIDWSQWFGAWPGQQDPRFGALWVVHMRLIRQDPSFGPPVNSEGSPAKIRDQIGISTKRGCVIGEETIKDLAHKKIAWSNRPSAATTPHLLDSARWDVLPCFRLSPSSNDHPWVFEPLPTPMDQLRLAAVRRYIPAALSALSRKSVPKKAKRKSAQRG